MKMKYKKVYLKLLRIYLISDKFYKKVENSKLESFIIQNFIKLIIFSLYLFTLKLFSRIL